MQQSLEEEMQVWEQGTPLPCTNLLWALTHCMAFGNLLHLSEMGIITLNHHTQKNAKKNDGEP